MAIENIGGARPADQFTPLISAQQRPSLPTVLSDQGGSTAISALQSGLAPISKDATSLPSAPPDRTEIQDAVAKVQKVVATQASNLLFSIDEGTGRTIVKVVDASTKETIRQIPSEEILSIAKALDKLQGLLLKETA